MSPASSILLLAVALLAWLAKGLVQALRDRLAARVASWALPEGQAWTYKLAVGVARLAEIAAPRRRRILFRLWVSQEIEPRLSDESEAEWFCQLSERPAVSSAGGFALALRQRVQNKVLPYMYAREIHYAARFEVFGELAEDEWGRPQELMAELEADLREARPVGGPLSMALPVLRQAIGRRARVGAEACAHPLLVVIGFARSTRAIALLEAKAYERRYPNRGIRSIARLSATRNVLAGRATVAEMAARYEVPSRAVRLWVAMAYRDAKRLRRGDDIPMDRRQVAEAVRVDLSAERAR